MDFLYYLFNLILQFISEKYNELAQKYNELAAKLESK